MSTKAQDVAGEAALFESAAMQHGLENYTESDYERLFRAGGLLPAGPPYRVFEAGCGSGAFGRRLARYGYKVDGVDISRTLVAVANKEARREKLPYRAAVGDLNKIPSQGRYDVVLCPMVLHHFVDLEAIMPALLSRLKPGGALVAIEPNGSHPAVWLGEFLRRRLPFVADRADVASPNETNHTIGRYRRAFTAAGLTMEHVTASSTEQIDGDYGPLLNPLLKVKKLLMQLGWWVLPRRFGGNILVVVARKGVRKALGPASVVMAAGHVSETYGPVQALADHLGRYRAGHRLIELPFLYSALPHATTKEHGDGRLLDTQAGHARRGPDPWLWARDFFYVLSQGWRQGRVNPPSLFIGVDALNASAGVILRWLGLVQQVAFYVIDYTDRRFGNPVLNWVYHAFDRFAATQADVVWNLSERMQEVRRGQGVAPQRNQVVPVGVELEAVRQPTKARRRAQTLLYMGSLHANKGIQLIVEAMPQILRRVPKAQLHIFGSGPYESELRRLIAASPARRRIHLRGHLGHAQLFKEAPRYSVALAPYLEEPHSYSYWCDPTKPKEYLACGLPVIITRVPWIWRLIGDKRRPMGAAIAYERDELVAACVKLLGERAFHRACRQRALAYAAGLSWDKIFSKALAELPLGR